MKYCSYKIGNQRFDSYGELLEYIKKIYTTDNLDITDLVFSKTVKKDSQTQKLQEIKQENIEEVAAVNLIDGEPSYKDKYAVTQFINDDSCNINGHRLVTQFNIEDYKSSQVKLLIEQNISPEVAEQQVQDSINNWPKVAEDGVWIHKIVNNKNFLEKDSSEYISKLRDIPERLNDNAVLAKLHQQLRTRYIMEKGRYPDSEAFLGLTIKSKLKTLDKEIFGKIDWLFVGQDGVLHLYLFKTSSQNPRDWVDVKEKNYLYHLAFIKQMLANNGIDVSGIDLNIIPIQLQYNSNYNKVNSVIIHPTINYSTRRRDPRYAMDKYERQVSSFITSNYIPFSISSEPLNRALEVSQHIFPTLNLKETGLATTAVEWIKYAPSMDPTGTEPLVIKKIDDNDYAYEVIINGESHKIEQNKNKEQKLLQLVTDHLNELTDNRNYATQRLKDALRQSFKLGEMIFSETKGLNSISHNLEGVFMPYIMDYYVNQDKEKIFNYELIDDYLDNNIIIFKHKDTGTLHFIALTTYDINSKVNLGLGDRILGAYRIPKDDLELEANFGNIEAVRTMEIINEILPSLGDIRLGSLSVVGLTNGASQTFNIGEFNRKYFQKITEVVNSENEGLNIKNNFATDSVRFLDPTTELIEKLNTILQGRAPIKAKIESIFDADELQNAKTQETQKAALTNLISQILFSEPSFSNPELVERVRGNHTTRGELAEIYNLATRALMYLQGTTPTRQTSYSNIYTRGLFTPMTVPDINLRTISEWLQTTHDQIASEFNDMYNKYLYDAIFDFYKAKGYTSFENITLGDSRRVYLNLFEKDNNGNFTMNFKNPYDNSNDLTKDERVFLKKALFIIAKINTNGNFPYSSETDSRLPEYINSYPAYLWVPLQRASASSSRQSLKSVKAKLRNTFKRLINWDTAFDEFVEGMLPQERNQVGEGDFYDMSISNIYDLSLPSSTRYLSEVEQSRTKLLEEYSPDFFETNVENILVDFLAKQISITQFNKFLVSAKAFMYQLHLTGEFNGNKDIVEKEKKWINAYIKVNTFNTSIMSETEKKIVGIITPFKQVTNHLLLAGNLVSYFRDIFQGAQENFIRTFIKFNTDITPSEVSKAYAYVHTHSTSNAMAQNLLSRLCQVYRISNMDVGRIASRYKTDRNGMLNVENRVYSTLRSPDYLNRMTLFVARCMHDGSWDAFSLDERGQLKYDWTKDKRFAAYKTAPKDSKEYRDAKSAYLSAVRQYNMENPDHQISPDEGLPSPYSNIEMNNIRGLADNIYGAYDRSKKIMAENESYGYAFLTFYTWMNGTINTYFMPAQRNNTSRLKQEQVIDDKGRPLFYDENNNYTTEDTGAPVLTWVPAPVQGIIPLIGDLYRIMHKDGFTALKEYINGDEYTKAALRKLGTDSLYSLLMWLLFTLLFNPAYREQKKNMKDNPVLANLLTEIMFKSWSRSYDSFMGPLNVIQFFGENTNPPFYSNSVQIMKDAASVAFGDKSFKYLLFNQTGFTRSFKDTGFAFIDSLQ